MNKMDSEPLGNGGENDRFGAAVERHLMQDMGVAPLMANAWDWMQATAMATRDRLADRWVETQRDDVTNQVRRAYYLSAEFLIGRAMSHALAALGLDQAFEAEMQKVGANAADVLESEPDAALGNGGLGRLAACFLDSLATLGVPSFGYGIRYEFGMFTQRIVDGKQVEVPDTWLARGNPWEFPRPDVFYPIQYGGWVDNVQGRPVWMPSERILARAYDMIVPGYGTERVSTLRLWRATALEQLDLAAHTHGDYSHAAELRSKAENISWVLYPDDSTPQGRELRLRQEYFFVSASLQDIVARHLRWYGTLNNLHEKVAIQLNDTHPALSVPELMRLLMDVHDFTWEEAWSQVEHIVSYTNHTLMPEAIESWAIGILQYLLPRHLEIIYEINSRFLAAVEKKFPGDKALLNRVSLIAEEGERRVRMGYLCIVASTKVNGVAQLHSDLMVRTIFADFAKIFPDRFTNVTNGVTPRRWLAQCNRGLAGLIDEKISDKWRTDLDQLKKLDPYANDKSVRDAFAKIKFQNKERLAAYIEHGLNIKVDPHALFDVQVKRMHEYKRQLLNVLHIVQRYREMIADPDADWLPRVHIFAGKAASAYRMAKLIIHLIHDVAHTVNNDVRLRDRLKVVFLPDYRVSVAEKIFPAADVSEQISTAGTEASGTGNMKFALNGAMTVGTWDGANIEIAESVGLDNIFIFGLRTEEIENLFRQGYNPRTWYEGNADLKAVLDMIGSGYFSPEEPARYQPVVDALLSRDQYFLLADFAAYVNIQREVDAVYRDQDRWLTSVVHNVAAMGKFSSDRTIREYCERIWKVLPSHHD
ncbi:MAG: glycogen/starch/alpha-glucan phosphorylase [Betaproteobacteria bacterium]|nr:glycogen/starch/alpha-glucan phosphorylase [Betaproteobacteria bacterium]